MAEYEVVVGLYRKGSDEPEQESVLLETDDHEEALEEFHDLVGDEDDYESGDGDDGEDDETE